MVADRCHSAAGGARQKVSVYQALARLRAACLVEMKPVRLGPIVGDSDWQ
jgi:hypothetical protein